MNFLLQVWRRIGTRLYLCLGFAVTLTMVSSAVGIYYFEQSGEATYDVRTLYVPAATAALEAQREGAALLLLQQDAQEGALEPNAIEERLDQIDAHLSGVTAIPNLTDQAKDAQQAVYQAANDLQGSATAASTALQYQALADEATLESQELKPEERGAIASLLAATSQKALEEEWQALGQLEDLDQQALDTAHKAFQAKGATIQLQPQLERALKAAKSSGEAMTQELAGLKEEAESQAETRLEDSVGLFDRGRQLLTLISVLSVTLASITAWLLVGNGLVRPLERLSDRMRDMASGDIETPVPGVGQDEVGQLAGALEVFRAQAHEVQRLNLVEKLYGELQKANDELKRMQDRLIAQEKLAALGELIAGVAHEISNPLNFVQNFSEVTMEMYSELAEVLDQYEDTMTEEHRQTVDDIKEDMLDSLTRIQNNGGRALAIVERMRALGVTGGELVEADVNHLVRSAVEVATTAFLASNSEMQLETMLDLQPDAGAAALVEHDFGEAVINLISNACHAMLERSQAEPEGYTPLLSVTTRRNGSETTVRVHDNGTGISSEALPQIFNPFYSTHEGIMGAGLGLTIAADVARRLGGAITVETEEGSHSAFTITLPAATPPDTDVLSTQDIAMNTQAIS